MKLTWYKSKFLEKNNNIGKVISSEINKNPVLSASEETEIFKLYEYHEDALLDLFLQDKDLTKLAMETFEANISKRTKNLEQNGYGEIIGKYQVLSAKNYEFKEITALARSFRNSAPLRSAFQAHYSAYISNNDELDAFWKSEVDRLEKELSKIKNRIVLANLGLVIAFAKRYLKSSNGSTFSDNIQEGNLGLIRAIEKFDYSREIRFSTYASWWIKQSIMRNIDNYNHEIRIPTNVSTLVRLYNKVEAKTVSVTGETPTSSDMAKKLGVDESRLNIIKEVKSFYKATTVSMNSDSTSEVHDIYDTIVVDEASPDDVVYNKELKKVIKQIMHVLTEQEAYIIGLRFGLSGGHPLTLHEIGEKVGLTRERIRQLEARALGKLKQKTVSLRKEYDGIDCY